MTSQGGFHLASPVKTPHASEPPRCAPPHTIKAGEEPEEGGHIRIRSGLRRGRARAHSSNGKQHCVGLASALRLTACVV